jgi:hypothetical protein
VDKVDIALFMAASVTSLLSGYVAWRVSISRHIYPVSTFSKLLIVCLLFLFFRGTVDTFLGIHGDSALNLLMGTISLILVLMLCSPTQYQKGLFWGGVWMLVRGLLNIGLFVWMGSGSLVETLTTMPISALPNLIISYVLPFVVAGFLIKTYSQKTQAI